MNTTQFNKKILAITIPLIFSTGVIAADVPDGITLSPTQNLIIGNGSEPETLDPTLAQDNVSLEVINDLFETLVTWNKSGNKIIPGQARSWDVSQDGKTITFHLRKNLKWSDGTSLTASDFVYSMRRLADPKTGSPKQTDISDLGIINSKQVVNGALPTTKLGVSAPDDSTLIVKLSEPLPYAIQFFTQSDFVPLPSKSILKWGSQWTKPEHIISNGAYQLKEHVVNDSIVSVRNPYYWDNTHTVINKVTYLPANEQTEEKMFRTNQIDWTSTIPAGIPFEKLKNKYKEQLVTMPLLGNYFYDFNLTKKKFQDVRVRRALSLLVDRDAIANKILKTGVTPTNLFLPKAMSGWVHPSNKIDEMSYDEKVTKAKELLKEAGYSAKKPLKIHLVYNTMENHKLIAQAIASMWSQVGVKVKLDNMEWKTFLDFRRNPKNDWDIVRDGTYASINDPTNILISYTTGDPGNLSHFTDKGYDSLYQKAKYNLNKKDRANQMGDLADILSDEQPAIQIYSYVQNKLIKPYVGGFHGNPFLYWPTKNLYIIKH